YPSAYPQTLHEVPTRRSSDLSGAGITGAASVSRSTDSADMARRPRPLDAAATLQLPLSGSKLIEASAGTGKTYTIANLYLRYVLDRKSTRLNSSHVKISYAVF